MKADFDRLDAEVKLAHLLKRNGYATLFDGATDIEVRKARCVTLIDFNRDHDDYALMCKLYEAAYGEPYPDNPKETMT